MSQADLHIYCVKWNGTIQQSM